MLNKAAEAVAGHLDLEKVVQIITDAGVELSGAAFGAFFYNQLDEKGESYTLYTLSGASRAAFSSFPMPRNTAVFGPTFAGEAIIRSDDITKDARYGKNAPNRGMPKGHLPVRSYLAAPVKSRNGKVLGGLFFGHPQPGVFGALAEEMLAGLAAQAAVAMDNAALFQSGESESKYRRRVEDELQALNATLEERVQREINERVRMEEALRQAQKMEAIGQLTGGVAHDFNNLLTVIMGGLDTIRRSKPGEEVRIKRALEVALQGTQRAASLTGRLLAFSRRQPLDPKPIDLNNLVRVGYRTYHDPNPRYAGAGNLVGIARATARSWRRPCNSRSSLCPTVPTTANAAVYNARSERLQPEIVKGDRSPRLS